VPYFDVPAEFDGVAEYKVWKEAGNANCILHLFRQDDFMTLVEHMAGLGITMRLREQEAKPLFYNRNWQIGQGLETIKRKVS
jgi:hypothetical protein